MSENLVAIFLGRQAAFGAKPAIVWRDAPLIDFAGLPAMVGRYRAALTELGVKRGDRVMVKTENSPSFVYTYLAVLASGAIFVPMNAAYTAAEVALLIEDALKADLPVLYQCRSGSCSSCLASLTAGEADTRAGASSTLLASERAEGFRLLCVTEPHGNCRFELCYDSEAGASRPVEGHAFVNAVERVAADVVRLELELAEGCWFDFRPGQFVQIKVPGTDAMRSYSMSSTPGELPKIELLIRILPGGVMSEWLTQRAAPDDVVEISGPYGHFFLREKVRAPHIMIAGGTGLAPMMSMIDSLRGVPGRKPQMLLSFGCQSAEGLFHLDALDLRRHWLPTLDLRISVERGSGPEGVRIGNPVAAIGTGEPIDPASVAYLCGPPGMIDAARRHLEGLGLAPENIFAEQFTASGT